MHLNVQVTLAILPLLSGLSSAGAVPQKRADICDVKGYDRGEGNYDYDDSGEYSIYDACSARCAADTKCKSFGFGDIDKVCMLFDIALSGNFDEDSTSPDTYYDRGCIPSSYSSTGSTSSTKTTAIGPTTTAATSTSTTKTLTTSLKSSTSPKSSTTSGTVSSITSNSSGKVTTTSGTSASSKTSASGSSTTSGASTPSKSSATLKTSTTSGSPSASSISTKSSTSVTSRKSTTSGTSVTSKTSTTSKSSITSGASTTSGTSTISGSSTTSGASSTVTVPSGCSVPTTVSMSSFNWFNSTHNLDCVNPNYPSDATVCWNSATNTLCADSTDTSCTCTSFCLTGLPTAAYQPFGYGPEDTITIGIEGFETCIAASGQSVHRTELGEGRFDCGSADIIGFYGDSNKDTGNTGSVYFNAYYGATCNGQYGRYTGSFPLTCTHDDGFNATCTAPVPLPLTLSGWV